MESLRLGNCGEISTLKRFGESINFLDQKIEALERRLGFPSGTDYDDFVLHQLISGRHRIMPHGMDRLLTFLQSKEKN
jgi:hypothetical protein